MMTSNQILKSVTTALIPLLILGLSKIASAHGVVWEQENAVGEYTVRGTGLADDEFISENYPATYTFELLSKDGSQPVPYESAHVNFVNEEGILVFYAQIIGPHGQDPGGLLVAAMPHPGKYSAEITFQIPKEAPDQYEKVEAKFEFPITAGETEIEQPAETMELGASQLTEMPELETQLPTEFPESDIILPRPDSPTVPGYVWALGVFALGLILGRFGSRIFGFFKVNEEKGAGRTN